MNPKLSICSTPNQIILPNDNKKNINDYIVKRVDDSVLMYPLPKKSLLRRKAWHGNDLNEIWASKLANKIKVEIFPATVEHILLHGSETWTLPGRLEKRLGSCYTILLMKVKNLS